MRGFGIGWGGCREAFMEDVGWDWAVENEKRFLSKREKKEGIPRVREEGQKLSLTMDQTLGRGLVNDLRVFNNSESGCNYSSEEFNDLRLVTQLLSRHTVLRAKVLSLFPSNTLYSCCPTGTETGAGKDALSVRPCSSLLLSLWSPGRCRDGESRFQIIEFPAC